MALERLLPEGLEPGHVASQLHSDTNEVFRRPSRQLCRTHVGQLAQSRPSDYRVAHEREHRHAHPQRIQTGGVAIVGESVQCDIDLAVCFEELIVIRGAL